MTGATFQECECSLIRRCKTCTDAENARIDYTGGAAVPAPYTDHDDVNPVCGHHKRNLCLQCGACTTCDGCYCGEE